MWGGKILLHSYMGSASLVKDFLKFGCMFSISIGCLTEKHLHMVKVIPLDNLVLESDSPCLFNKELVDEYEGDKEMI